MRSTAVRVFLAAISLALVTACSRPEATVNPSEIMPMLGAVMHSETDEVRRLAELHIGLDERSSADNATPMIAAAQTDQWPVVEILIDHGADIWALDEFGITAAQRTITAASCADQRKTRRGCG